MQSPHFVQRSRNTTSSTAPGGRSQSVRKTGAGASGTASTCLENSCAALATDITESFRKSRLPYEGLEAMVFVEPADDQNACSTRPQQVKGRRVLSAVRGDLERCENKVGRRFHHLHLH